MRLGIAVVLGMTLLGGACDTRRGQVASRPGETTAELDAAGEALAAVGESAPLIEVRVSSAEASEERRSVGAVIGDDGRVVVDARTVSLHVGRDEDAGIAHTRSVEAVFHPGGDAERRYPATVLRESDREGVALLAVEGHAAPGLRLGDDLPDGARVFLIAAPFSMARLVAQPGSVSGYAEIGDGGRSIVHDAGGEQAPSGPLVDTDGAVIGLQLNTDPRRAVPAVEIARWLQTPRDDELPPSDAGQVLERLLKRMDAHFRAAEPGGGCIVSRADGVDLRVRQIENVISVQVDLGALHVGDAIEALRSNYTDPVGALALGPGEGGGQLLWVCRLPVENTTASYLGYVFTIASAQSGRWRRLEAGLEPDYPYDLYPGGDEATHGERLLQVVRSSSLQHELSGEGYKLQPDADVPVFVNIFRGMAYVYAYSGGIPGTDAFEQEQVARSLLGRNWELPLGRLALDKHKDLAWEAQVPIEHLSPRYLEALTRICASEIARLTSEYGDVPFNEQ